MKANKDKPNRRHLYSLYQRVKNKKDENDNNLCCEEWGNDPESFYVWYENRFKEQNGLCEYCHLQGDTTDYYNPKGFRKGRRGFNLEVDRKDGKGLYSPENCVLACYPCNNAKSDVFSYEEFREIGKTIGRIKRRAA